MNAELCKQALEKVGNPNILVNLVSRRVRQLNAGGGAHSRPLVSETAGLSVTDIALKEILEEKISWEVVDESPLSEGTIKKRKKT